LHDDRLVVLFVVCCQPLLDVDHTSARLNLLTPRYVNQKGVALPTSSAVTRRAKRENLQQKQILVPELCDVHPFPASLWRKAVCLPAMLYRVNCLLIAEELRRCIAVEAHVGYVDGKWNEFDGCPALRFGFCDISQVSTKQQDVCPNHRSSDDGAVECRQTDALAEAVEDMHINSDGTESAGISSSYSDNCDKYVSCSCGENYTDDSCCCRSTAVCCNSDVTLCANTSDCTERLLNGRCDERSIPGPEYMDGTISINTTCFRSRDSPTHCCCVENTALDTNSICDCHTEVSNSETCHELVSESCSFSLDADTSLSGGPSPCDVIQALTMSNANDFFNLERLETIGDSFLKFAISIYLYCMYPGIHEGKLSYLRSIQVSYYAVYAMSAIWVQS